PPSFLDKGTFKTASKAKLTLLNATSLTGLGTHPNIAEDIALKRVFKTETRDGVIKCYPAADEKIKILNEAKLMGWAVSLLHLAHSFINQFLKTAEISPPFQIPNLCFVHAGIAFAQKEIDAIGSAHSSLRASYILKELIQSTELPFQKYIHNSNAIPLQEPWEKGYNMGIFLCFVQHIQYQETAHQAYISDFQGGKMLLTNPQVMTNP
ncbi:hypothetical protein CVT25_015773, partial [Psilocybe cyanescens]